MSLEFHQGSDELGAGQEGAHPTGLPSYKILLDLRMRLGSALLILQSGSPIALPCMMHMPTWAGA